jgi:uncharacterized membrane protein
MMEVPGGDTPNTSSGSAAADSGRARAWKRITHWFTPGRLVTIAIIVLVAGLLIYVVVSRGAEGTALREGTQPDASVLISTLILIYTVFMAVYGALLPMFIARDSGAWEWLAIVLMVLAILLNLWRIQNSLGDLYTTTMRQLTPNEIHDADYEFMHYYFVSNVVVIVMALVVISRPRRPTKGRHPGSDRPQMTDPQ